ncbi:O-acetyl-ADP-ribose deacetylase (regulator of RNase III), contains Macro domain [Humidesulfovibrio mexicanus]|uniref:O-acetyl-ADP-ribose deacetylase (Regulator of RNase III), contains Macro domain n=2 Tax=Humidesulfovibrio mexicanus TaxID=147047 RepID=A0A238XL56_9BACT|nr:O-acetyl-ADP-ribose deacetylase (regulator of RNase III), contains Macro domain [Humidesulfovibrio mexicanus]
MSVWRLSSGYLELVQGDLTQAPVDAIVNAANPGLLGGGGVDGAIHAAAGPELLGACRELLGGMGCLATGQAVITPGFRLRARFVIHTVGPIWYGGGRNEEGLLRSAYLESLRLARANDLENIAFPAISCGAYGYPLHLAAPTALGALRHGLELGLAKHAGLWLHGPQDFDFWSGKARELLGPPQTF